MPWHLTLSRDQQMAINYVFTPSCHFFRESKSQPLSSYMVKDIEWLRAQYHTRGSYYLLFVDFPRNWQFYKFRLNRSPRGAR
jgi:hypothetical protein